MCEVWAGADRGVMPERGSGRDRFEGALAVLADGDEWLLPTFRRRYAELVAVSSAIANARAHAWAARLEHMLACGLDIAFDVDDEEEIKALREIA